MFLVLFFFFFASLDCLSKISCSPNKTREGQGRAVVSGTMVETDGGGKHALCTEYSILRNVLMFLLRSENMQLTVQNLPLTVHA